METAVKLPGRSGEALRVRSRSVCGQCAALRVLVSAPFALIGLLPARTSGQVRPPSSPQGAKVARASSSRAEQEAPKTSPPTAVPGRPKAGEPAPPPQEPLPAVETVAAPRFKVRDEFEQCVVARLHGQYRDKTALILPDGQLGTSSVLVPTDEPFQPLTADQLLPLLHNGPFAGYQLLKTDHYLIFYKSTDSFAKDSGHLLEDLYRGLIDTFRRNHIPVHESEFPLVAVIFATERDFRNHKVVDPQVRAYYEFFTNRIFFFQKSDRDTIEPKVAALLKPQTVAHEGAHQILSNIGVQPRPCEWPPWLVEGLAEYCATTINTKKGIVWSGLGAINSLHMATIRELEDPLSNEVSAPAITTKKVARQVPTSWADALMLKTSLTPTDYAEAWALTHYLAQKRGTDFVNYLNAMRRIPPLEPRTPQENLDEFRKFFDETPARLDKRLGDYIYKLSQKKTYDSLYYYAVIFQQPLGNGVIRRSAMVSQSPQIIQQWVQKMTSPTGDEPIWQADPFPTHARAVRAAEDWIRSP